VGRHRVFSFSWGPAPYPLPPTFSVALLSTRAYGERPALNLFDGGLPVGHGFDEELATHTPCTNAGIGPDRSGSRVVSPVA